MLAPGWLLKMQTCCLQCLADRPQPCIVQAAAADAHSTHMSADLLTPHTSTPTGQHAWCVRCCNSNSGQRHVPLPGPLTARVLQMPYLEPHSMQRVVELPPARQFGR